MKFVIAAALVALAVVLLTTRIGVFIVFDIFGDLVGGTDNLALSAETGPLEITESRQAVNEIDLPGALEQPSGLHITDDGIFIATDQAEIFRIDSDGSLVYQRNLLSGPLLLKQGSVEAIVTFGSELFVAGELGEVQVWRHGEHGIVWSDPMPLSPPYDEFEFSGLTMFGGSLMAVDGESTLIHNLTTGKSYNLDFSSVLKEGRSADELVISGIASDFARLYVITENFSSVLVVHPQGWMVERVVDIDDVEASDVAVYQGLVFVTVDHNYFDERVPILVYDNIAFAPLF